MSESSCTGLNVSSGTKVKVDGSDTTADFLSPKLAAGAGVTLTILNPGGNEQVEIAFSGSNEATPSRTNKHMPASVTVADGDLACATAIAVTPAISTANGGYVGTRVNGLYQFTGDGTKVGVDCYFSNDGGATARALKNVVVGDLLYWNGTIAKYQLAITDNIDFDFATAS